jgi:hypothetical protein
MVDDDRLGINDLSGHLLLPLDRLLPRVHFLFFADRLRLDTLGYYGTTRSLWKD